MSRFADNAAKIFEAAQCAVGSGHSLSEMTILVGSGGGIRMVVDSDWSLESLRAHHGAQMAFRVSEQETTVRVEGRAGWQTCMLKTVKPDRVARLLLGSTNYYPVIPALPALPAPDLTGNR